MGWISDFITNVSAFRIKIGEKLLILKAAINLKANIDGSNIPPATQWANLHAGGLDGYLFHGGQVGSNFENVFVETNGGIFQTNVSGFRTWVGIGTMSDLTTTHKTTIVGAINEVNTKSTNIKIGGRNLLLDTGIGISNTFGNAAFILVKTFQRVSLEAGEKYVLSMDMKFTGNIPNKLYFYAELRNGLSYEEYYTETICDYSGIFKRYNSTLTVTVSGDADIYILIANPNMATVPADIAYVRNAKLEKGNIPTDWTPAPEDKVNKSGDTMTGALEVQGVTIGGTPNKLRITRQSSEEFGVIGESNGWANMYVAIATQQYHAVTLAQHQNKADINGGNTTGGSWKIDYILSDVLQNSIGNSQVINVLSNGTVHYGSNALNYHMFIGNSVDSFKVHINNLGDGHLWHSFNFNPLNALMNRGTGFVSNNDADQLSIGNEIVAIETANGSGNTNFPINTTYGNFIRKRSRTFTTDYFHLNGGELLFKTWYTPSGAGIVPWRKVWDDKNLDPIRNLGGAYGLGFSGGNIDEPYLQSSSGTNAMLATRVWTINNFIQPYQIVNKVDNLQNATGIGFANGSFSGLPYFYHPTGGQKFLVSVEYLNAQDLASVTYVNTAISNAVANIPVHNGQLTVNTTADLVGGFVYLPSGAITTTFGLATHVLDAIADGNSAKTQITSLFADATEYFKYNDVSGGGSVDANEAFFNLVNPTTVSGLTIDIGDHYINGARLVLQGVAGVGGTVTYKGRFTMRNHGNLGTLTVEGEIDQEFVWDANIGRWREVF